MNRFFISEDLVGFNVIAHQTATADTAIVSAALDKTALAKGSSVQGGLALLLKKTTDASRITEVLVTHCDTVGGTYTAVEMAKAEVSVLKEKLANIDQDQKFFLLGLKEDVLKKYFKVSIKCDTAEAVEVLGLVSKSYGE